MVGEAEVAVGDDEGDEAVTGGPDGFGQRRDVLARALQIGDVVALSEQGSEVEATVAREIDRTELTVRVTLRVEGREDFIKEWPVGKNKAFREITLYLPLYKGVSLDEIVLDANAKVEPPASFALSKPVVFYGSSITQGGCASNPGMSCQAQVARWFSTSTTTSS